jgi:hypothetical protein
VNSQLSDVSCPGRRACHAVGVGLGADGTRALAERFDGASWQLESTPSTGGDTRLAGVSCPSRFFCMALGQVSAPGGGTLAEKWTP